MVVPAPADPILHLTGVCLQQRNELRDGACGKIFADFEHHRLLGEQRDRGEIVDGVVAPLLVDRLVIGVGSGATQQQRIAIGRGVDDTGHPDDAASAGRILDDQRLAQQLAHPRRKNAAHDVERAARGIGDDHDDRPRGIGLSLCRG